MGTFPGTCEIVESVDELDSEFQLDDNIRMHHDQKYSIEDDINRLFEAIDIRASRRASGQLQQNGAENFRKSAMKRPMRAGLPQAAGIGISESVSLKQALRGLCISQASEMAAMKRLSKPSGLSRVSESGTIKRLYRAVVVEANESGQLLHEGKENLVEISLVPETSTSNFCRMQDKLQVEKANLDAHPSTHLTALQDGIRSTPIDSYDGCSKPVGKECSKLDLGNQESQKSTYSPSHTDSVKKLSEVEEIIPASVEVSSNLVIQEKEQEADLHSESSGSRLKSGIKILKSASSGPRLMRPVFRSKKLKSHSTPAINSSSQYNGAVSDGPSPCTSKMDCHTPDSTLRHASEEKDRASQLSSSINVNFEASLHAVDPSDHRPGFTSNCGNRPAVILTKPDERSRSKEKGEFSQSSKSSLGEYSSSTSFSEESNLSTSNRGGYRPHMSKDLRWEAIHAIQKQHGSLSLRLFKLLKKLGGGDIGTVYLAELSGTNCLFALKIMDNEFLAARKKMPRAQTEREIMQMLDHPFLPTLFAHFTTDKFSCLVMEYCPGGDLHVLRQRQPSKSFSEEAARFYVAEVLLALEYLHMLGVVYRDLKPENILVREDGHIMLTDFDLSLRCAVNPVLVKSTSPVVPPKKISSPCSDSSCIEPFCLQPSCFTPRLLSAAARTRKLKADLAAQVSPLPQLVVEPTNARSNSFVGTHEYLSPEIIKGEGHGSPVDWWTFGIFLYELLCGRTPFKGSANEDTLANVVSRPLRFPETPIVSFHARDLIRRLLQKDPENRLGSVKGAAEIKHHPFFEGLNWALIRCAMPPELPKHCDFGNVSFDTSSHNYKENTKSQKDCNGVMENSEFEMF